MHRADDAHQRCEHAQGGATGFFGQIVGRENAGVAGRIGLRAVKHRDLPVHADGRAGYQGFAVLHAGQVHGLAGFKVVAAIDHHIGLRHQGVEQSRIGPLGDGGHLHIGVDLCNGCAHRFGFGLADPVQGVGNLALQVGGIDLVVVDHGDVAHARTAQIKADRRAQAARTDDEGA